MHSQGLEWVRREVTPLAQTAFERSMKQVDPYEELNVNVYGVLKPPLLLWLIMLIETWHFWSSIFIAFSGETWLFTKGFGWMNFAAETPALLVLAALSARMPKMPKFVPIIWHRGRELLTLAAVGNLGIIVFGAIQVDFWRLSTEWSTLLAVFLHVWVLVRVWVSPIIQKVFSEFPK